MQNFLIALEVVFPLFFMIASGYAVSRMGWLSKITCKEMNRVVFRLCMPFLIFKNLYYADTDILEELPFVGLATVLVLVTIACSCLWAWKTESHLPRRGVVAQAIFRTNFLIFAIPIVDGLYGAEGVALASVLVVIVVPIYNFFAVIILETCRGGKLHLGKLFIQIITNPFIYAAILGVIVKSLNISLYGGLESVMGDAAGLATPVVLFLLGAEFDFSSAKNNMKVLVRTVGIRLILVPAIALPVCVALGMRDVQLAILTALVSTPVAVSSYSMAVEMQGDSELAGQIVVFSTVFSAITLVFWIFLLKQLGLF